MQLVDHQQHDTVWRQIHHDLPHSTLSGDSRFVSARSLLLQFDQTGDDCSQCGQLLFERDDLPPSRSSICASTGLLLWNYGFWGGGTVNSVNASAEVRTATMPPARVYCS